MFFRTARLAAVRFARAHGFPRSDFTVYPVLDNSWLFTVYIGQRLAPRIALMVVWNGPLYTTHINVFGRWLPAI